MRRGNRVELSSSVIVSVEMVRQAIEVQLGSRIRLISMQVDPGEIKKKPDHHIPTYQWRVVEVQGEFVTLTESGLSYAHSPIAKFKATIAIEQDFSGDFWAPIAGGALCALSIYENFEGGTRRYVVRWAAATSSRTRLIREVELQDLERGTVVVGIDHENRRSPF